MGDFSDKHITSIKEILSNIDHQQNTVILNNNNIKRAKLELLPDNISNVYIDYNIVNLIQWDNRNWGTLCVKNNNLDTEEFDGLTCEQLILDNNNIKTMTFANCKINNLSIVNNEIISINFFDCYIEKLNLSHNFITNIITLPSGLKELKLSSNKISSFLTELNDDLIYLDISENKLDKIPNLPSTLKYLDLKKNKIEMIDISKIPMTLEYLDIMQNKIKNCDKIFNDLKDNITEIFYDSDDENYDSNSTTTINSSEISELDEIKLNYINSFQNNCGEIKIDDDNNDDCDDDIERVFNEYRNELEQKDKEYEYCNIMTNNNSSDEDNISFDAKPMLNHREILFKMALDRFRMDHNNNLRHNIENKIIRKIFLPIIPVELKWNIKLN